MGYNKTVVTKKALVLGAGLAGCNIANALAKRGWEVILLEDNQSAGLGASSNHQAIIYPKFSGFHSPMNDFMLSAYLFALRTYAKILQKQPIGELSGILQLAHSQKEIQKQKKLANWFLTYPELGCLVDAKEISSLAGLEIQSPGLFIPGSGWMDSPKLCQYLITHKNIQFIPETKVLEIEHENNTWHIGPHSSEVLIIACGHQSNQFLQTKHLPLINVYGQVTQIKSSEPSNKLKIPLCGDGHVLPSRNGMHSVGATYHVDMDDANCMLFDQNRNLERLAAFSINVDWSKDVIGNWGAVRAATSDYLPLVGPVIHPDAFNECYKKISLDKNKWIETKANYLPGLYVCTGFGSRGLTSIPLCTEWLASYINDELSILPRSHVKALSPSRFLHRQLARCSHK